MMLLALEDTETFIIEFQKLCIANQFIQIKIKTFVNNVYN